MNNIISDKSDNIAIGNIYWIGFIVGFLTGTFIMTPYTSVGITAFIGLIILGIAFTENLKRKQKIAEVNY